MKDNGGYAFPSSGDYCDPRGMTLRDWFAGQALASGLCPHNVYEYGAMASWCGRMADAMLEERNKA